MKVFLLVATTLVLMMINTVCPIETGRVLNEYQKISHKNSLLLLSSLDNGGDPPSAPNPGEPGSTINEMNFAGHAMTTRPPMPKPIEPTGSVQS